MGLTGAAKSGSAPTQAIEDMAKWLDVKFIGFDLTSPVVGGPEDECPDNDPSCKKRREKQ